MKRWVLALLCVACGGSGTPAESAADAESPPAESASEPAEPSATDPAPAETPSDAPGANAGPASQEDVQAVLQLVIDDEELTPFLHLDRPERFPLRIAGDLPPGLTLTKATKPVEVVDASESKTKPVLVFTEISVQGTKASVRYRYDVESVRGACTLEKRDGAWVLARSRITER